MIAAWCCSLALAPAERRARPRGRSAAAARATAPAPPVMVLLALGVVVVGQCAVLRHNARLGPHREPAQQRCRPRPSRCCGPQDAGRAPSRSIRTDTAGQAHRGRPARAVRRALGRQVHLAARGYRQGPGAGPRSTGSRATAPWCCKGGPDGGPDGEDAGRRRRRSSPTRSSRCTREGKRIVYVVQGARRARRSATPIGPASARPRTQMEKANYEVKELVLAREPKVPDDAAIVIVAGPEDRSLPAGDRRARRLCRPRRQGASSWRRRSRPTA